jgi:hypothetical protein
MMRSACGAHARLRQRSGFGREHFQAYRRLRFSSRSSLNRGVGSCERAPVRFTRAVCAAVKV